MPFEIYKFLHLISIVAIILSFGLIIGHYKNNNTKNKAYHILHGISLSFILISGFGMLAKLSIHWPWPLWVGIKTLVWLSMGGIVILFKRKPCTKMGIASILVLAGLAIFSAIYHI